MVADEWKQEDIDAMIDNLNGLPAFDYQSVEHMMNEMAEGWMTAHGSMDHGEKEENPYDALIATMAGFDVSGQFNFSGYVDELRLMLAEKWEQEDIDAMIDNLNGLPAFDYQSVEQMMNEMAEGWMTAHGSMDHGEHMENPFDALIAAAAEFHQGTEFGF